MWLAHEVMTTPDKDGTAARFHSITEHLTEQHHPSPHPHRISRLAIAPLPPVDANDAAVISDETPASCAHRSRARSAAPVAAVPRSEAPLHASPSLAKASRAGPRSATVRSRVPSPTSAACLITRPSAAPSLRAPCGGRGRLGGGRRADGGLVDRHDGGTLDFFSLRKGCPHLGTQEALKMEKYAFCPSHQWRRDKIDRRFAGEDMVVHVHL